MVRSPLPGQRSRKLGALYKGVGHRLPHRVRAMEVVQKKIRGAGKVKGGKKFRRENTGEACGGWVVKIRSRGGGDEKSEKKAHSRGEGGKS